MIKLQDAELISVLPPYIKEDADVQAISYAFKLGMEKFLQYARISVLYGAIDVLPEQFIDLLALELQSQYYDESLDLGIKREIVRNSLAWYSKGGTVSAVEELISVLFGKGELEEWFQFGGKPGTFRIKLYMGDHDAEVDTQDIVQRIKSYKKLSAHFAAIVISYYFGIPIYCVNAAVRFQMDFYPRFNLPRLSLNGAWKLDGSQMLSGYDGAGNVDFYPIRARFRSEAEPVLHGGCRISLPAKAQEQAESRLGIAIRDSVSIRETAKERVTIKTAAEVKPAVEDVIVHNQNILDDAWMLDGSRELNGGDDLL